MNFVKSQDVTCSCSFSSSNVQHQKYNNPLLCLNHKNYSQQLSKIASYFGPHSFYSKSEEQTKLLKNQVNF